MIRAAYRQNIICHYLGMFGYEYLCTKLKPESLRICAQNKLGIYFKDQHKFCTLFCLSLQLSAQQHCFQNNVPIIAIQAFKQL